MTRISSALMLLAAAFSFTVNAQSGSKRLTSFNLRNYKMKYGIKAGYSHSELTTSGTGLYTSARKGFIIGGFIEPPSNTTGFGFRSELMFSRQGFSLREEHTNTNITQDYVHVPVLATFSLSKFLRLLAGLQGGYLINAKKEKTTKSPEENLVNLYNRLDYGFAGGIEITPISNFILGARYNGSFRKAFKDKQPGIQPVPPPFNPAGSKSRNSVMQLFVGYRF